MPNIDGIISDLSLKNPLEVLKLYYLLLDIDWCKNQRLFKKEHTKILILILMETLTSMSTTMMISWKQKRGHLNEQQMKIWL